MTAGDKVAAAFYDTCAIASGVASCWGFNQTGQVGNGTTTDQYSPVALPGTWSVVSPGYGHTCGVRTDGTLWCWGDDSYSQLGDGGNSQRVMPMQIGGDLDWADVGAGYDHSCAIKTNHTLWCWGSNTFGQLGLGTSAFGRPMLVP